MFNNESTFSSNIVDLTPAGMMDNLFKNATEDCHVRYVSFQMISYSNNLFPIPYVKTNYPPEWVCYYLVNDFMKIDPVVRIGRESSLPFFWTDIVATARERGMMKKAAEFGVSLLGYSVPTYDIGPYRGLFSISSKSEDVDEWRDRVISSRSKYRDIGLSLHYLARREIDPYSKYSVNLSPREIECLKYIAAGKTNTVMAKILGISEYTVRGYCRAARVKLNSSTLAQAVAKACAMGII